MCKYSLQLEEIWLSSSSSDDDHDIASQKTVSQPLWQMMFFLLLWQSLYRVSNAALNVLLKFLSTFVRVFGTVFASDRLQQFSSEIPPSTVAAHKLLWNTNESNFIEYVVCPSCHSNYEYNDCFIIQRGQKESKVCSHVAYPNHSRHSKRKSCGAAEESQIRKK